MADSKPPYVTLEDLDNVSGSREIIVRLIRKWEARNPRRGNILMSLDLLLLDEKDILIKASINHRLIGKFKNDLQEGSILCIKDFDLGKSYEKFKLADHKFTIYFSQLTTINEVLDDAPAIGKTKFRIFNYDNLLSIANTNEELPDVVGRIIFILGSNLRDIGSTKKIMARLLLEDGRKVRLTIWDNVASDFRALLSARNREKAVVVITAVNPKIFSGELYLNTSSATRFYMNKEIKEVKDYMLTQEMDNCHNSPLEERELEADSYGITTISHLFSFLDVEEPQEKTFYCKATIVEFETRNGWNYVSCAKCSKKLIKEEDHFRCSQCEDTNVIGIIRFRFEVLVDDGTEKGTFIIFDKDGRKLTNTLATDLKSIECESPTANKEEQLPACVKELIGRTYVFEVSIKPFDFKARYKTFTVSRIVNECFDKPHNSVKLEEENCHHKAVVRNNKQYLKRKKEEGDTVSLEEKKGSTSRGKKTKHNS